MSASEIYAWIIEASRQKTNLKKVLAIKSGAYEHGKLFTSFLRYVLDPGFNYYITEKQLPEPADVPCGTVTQATTFDGMLHLLQSLSDREITGDKAKAAIAGWLNYADPLLRHLFSMAISRQLPGKIGATIVNKALNGLIYKQPYPGVQAWDEAKAEKMFAPGGVIMCQPKMDGMALMIDTATREVRTRQGQLVTIQMDRHLRPLFHYFEAGYVLFVEANLWDERFEHIMPRPESNGVLNAVFQTGRPIDTERLLITVLDMIPAEQFYGWTKNPGPGALSRWKLARDQVRDYNSARNDMVRGWPAVGVVLSEMVSCLASARRMTQEIISAGGEGTVLKDPAAPFKNGKSGLKMKNEFECTLRVRGYKPHAKQAGWVGSLLCESEDGKLSTYVGSGLNEEDGHELNRTMGFGPFDQALVEVRAEKISKHNALDLPRIVEIRHDKEVADSYDHVLASYRDSTSV